MGMVCLVMVITSENLFKYVLSGQVMYVATTSLELYLSISNCTSFGILDISYNQITGEIPYNIGFLQVAALSLKGNKDSRGDWSDASTCSFQKRAGGANSSHPWKFILHVEIVTHFARINRRYFVIFVLCN